MSQSSQTTASPAASVTPYAYGLAGVNVPLDYELT